METRSGKGTGPRARARSRGTLQTPASGTAKRARNVSLSLAAISRGEAYAAAHGTTLSALVEHYLRGLPPLDDCHDTDNAVDGGAHDLAGVRAGSSSPLVRELAGLLSNGAGEKEVVGPREAYREHLQHRYGGR